MKRREVLSVLTVLSNGTPAMLSRTTTKKKATFVLVHGAWHGGWCWKKISALLDADGHQVYTPTLTGLGERSHLLSKEIDLEMHIQDVVSMLEYEDLYGGDIGWSQLWWNGYNRSSRQGKKKGESRCIP